MKTLILIKIIYKITNKHKIVFSYTIAGTRFDNFGFLTILDKKIRNRTEVTILFTARSYSQHLYKFRFIQILDKKNQVSYKYKEIHQNKLFYLDFNCSP